VRAPNVNVKNMIWEATESCEKPSMLVVFTN